MYIPLLKIEQTYYAIRNKAQAAPTVQQYIDELTEILSNQLITFTFHNDVVEPGKSVTYIAVLFAGTVLVEPL